MDDENIPEKEVMLNEVPVDPPLVFMITIVNRGYADRVRDLFAEEGVIFSLLTLGKGTADSKIICYLGLGETEKALLFSMISLESSKRLLKRLGDEVIMSKAGLGIAFTLPVNCATAAQDVHGLSLPGGNNMESIPQARSGDSTGEAYHHDLIIAIANQGFSEEVMEAARSAKATGGTVVHARGTGGKEAEKFFGVAIQSEKEMILILTRRELRRGIMEAIASRAGPQTDAKTVTFSLPVNDVVGLTSIRQAPRE